ncbi:MAG TPA: hypothetical protein DCZ03_13110 [Gammaproteobacteria bacterium]|nr:hypothetical protein [Gammaproteobacteria bacterium]
MFDDHFEVILANDEETRLAHFRLRHRIFCELKQFERVSKDRMERDFFDQTSSHFIVKSKASHAIVAGFRLISSNPQIPSALITELDDGILNKCRHGKIVELSRLCIDRELAIQTLIGVGLKRETIRPEKPIIAGMLRAASAHSDQAEVEGIVGIVPLTLLRVYRSLGIELKQCGQECRHRGKRVPYVGRPQQVLQALKENRRYFHSRVEAEYKSAVENEDALLPAAV